MDENDLREAKDSRKNMERRREVHTCIYATAEFTYGCTIAHCTLVLLLYSEVMMEEIAMLLVPVSL